MYIVLIFFELVMLNPSSLSKPLKTPETPSETPHQYAPLITEHVRLGSAARVSSVRMSRADPRVCSLCALIGSQSVGFGSIHPYTHARLHSTQTCRRGPRFHACTHADVACEPFPVSARRSPLMPSHAAPLQCCAPLNLNRSLTFSP